jgi:hypothetical protein
MALANVDDALESFVQNFAESAKDSVAYDR